MTFEEMKAAVLKFENGQQIFDTIVAAVETEKTRGIEAHRKNNQENQALRAYKKALEDLGYKQDEHGSLEEYIEAVKASQETGAKAKSKLPELEDVQKQLIKLKRDYETTVAKLTAEQQAKAEIEKRAKLSSIKSTLAKPFSEKFYASEFIIDGLIAAGTVDTDETGSVIFKDGDKVLDVNGGIAWAETKYADSRKNNQQPGAGSKPSNGGSVNQGRLYTKEEMAKMSPDQINANWGDVQKSLAMIPITK